MTRIAGYHTSNSRDGDATIFLLPLISAGNSTMVLRFVFVLNYFLVKIFTHQKHTKRRTTTTAQITTQPAHTTTTNNTQQPTAISHAYTDFETHKKMFSKHNTTYIHTHTHTHTHTHNTTPPRPPIQYPLHLLTSQLAVQYIYVTVFEHEAKASIDQSQVQSDLSTSLILIIAQSTFFFEIFKKVWKSKKTSSKTFERRFFSNFDSKLNSFSFIFKHWSLLLLPFISPLSPSNDEYSILLRLPIHLNAHTTTLTARF